MASQWKAGTLVAALILSVLSTVHAGPKEGRHWDDEGHHQIRHVLLISIDGMHALDFINCRKGINGVNGGEPYCPNLAELGETGINYLDTTTSKPSDSFPGLMALVSGGSPRTVGAFYDVAYDRSLDPPAITTGNGVAGGTCTPGAPPTGTRTEYDEGIDIDQTQLNGGAPSGDGGINSIDPRKLVRDPSKGCAPVYPWNFVRTNTIFGVVHAAGGYTAWSDKHPSYSSVSGPGDGTNVDDYYSPDINSAVVNLPGVTTPLGMSCAPIPDPSQVGSWTDSFQNIQCYDTLKVNAILNEIDGKTHNGLAHAPVPAVFGMNFQVVSVGQKLIEKNVGKGGYLDAIATPTGKLLGEIQFADAAIGEMISHLKGHRLLDSTLIIITAKHGQNPIDSPRFNEPVTTPATLLDAYLPDSEKPSNPDGIGPTEDDISLIWLSDSTQAENAVNLLETTSPPSNNVAGIAQIFWGPAITQMFNSPARDPRTPDIIVTPNGGVVFTGSSKKLAEHGGFSHDDTNVMMLLSNPSFDRKTIFSPVETTQVAPTILKVLGLDPDDLDAVKIEGTQVLPGVQFGGDHDR
jgi:Type I phosphodiesterase / nucleotide pyrophosphatase